jgi:hypothetical protein
LLYLQVYTAQRVEYAGGNFFGNETGSPTRTLLSFLVTSLGGAYEDMVCFIPTVTLNWSILLSNFLKVLRALHSIGFSIVLVLVDGHKTNIKFFLELAMRSQEICIPHPFDSSSPLFLMFDPVHLFKNFYHNFQKRRYSIFHVTLHDKKHL